MIFSYCDVYFYFICDIIYFILYLTKENYTMDRFSEQLIRKASTGKDVFIRVLYSVIAAAIIFVGFMLLYWNPLILVTLIGVVIWVLVLLMRDTFSEYKYIVTNDDLDIDKIIGKRKRKRLITVSLRSVKSIEPYESGSTVNSNVVVMAHDETGEDMYVLICDHKSYGETAVVFNPTKRTVSNIVGGMSPEIKKKYAELCIPEEDDEEVRGEDKDESDEQAE